MPAFTSSRRVRTDLGAMEKGEAGIPRAPTELSLPLHPAPPEMTIEREPRQKPKTDVASSEVDDVSLLPFSHGMFLTSLGTVERTTDYQTKINESGQHSRES